MIKKYACAEKDTQDLISVGTIGLIKAVNTFNPDKKIRLATYAAKCIDNEILMMLRNDKKKMQELSLYDYLYRCIKNDILSGRIPVGEKLPSKRSLAKHLDVSVITVENAYAQLLLEGYITSFEKKGYFVNDIGSAPSASCLIKPKPEEEFEVFDTGVAAGSESA